MVQECRIAGLIFQLLAGRKSTTCRNRNQQSSGIAGSEIISQDAPLGASDETIEGKGLNEWG